MKRVMASSNLVAIGSSNEYLINIGSSKDLPEGW